jgi:hypothetical protein
MCSPTHNAVAITIDYPPANLPPSELATQMPQATFSACSQTYSPTAPRVASQQSNRTRDPMQIKSLATYLKTYVIFFPHSPPTFHTPSLQPCNNDGLTPFPLFFAFAFATVCIASTARGRAASPIVDLVRRGMRCWSRVYHCQRARPRRRCICGQSTWGHSRCKGQECGRRVLRVGRVAESRGTRNTCLGTRAL